MVVIRGRHKHSAPEVAVDYDVHDMVWCDAADARRAARTCAVRTSKWSQAFFYFCIDQTAIVVLVCHADIDIVGPVKIDSAKPFIYRYQ